MALNVKIPLNKLNFIHDSIFYLYYWMGTWETFVALTLNIFVGLPTVRLLSSEDMLIYPMCRDATN